MSHFHILEQYLGYKFQDPNYLIRALSHQSLHADSTSNASHLEFIGSSCLYLAILQQSMIYSSPFMRAGQLVTLVDQITSSIDTIANLFTALGIKKFWKIEASLSERQEEKLWLISAIAGALFLDGGYKAVKALARKILLDWEHEIPQNDHIEHSFPWGQWPHRKTISLEPLSVTFPRILSEKSFRLIPWALETHCKPGKYNQRCFQFFELGDAALRWIVDFKLFQNNLLEPITGRHLQRENRLKFLGLEPRRDQTYASCFNSQDWRRQSLDYRTQSLKNILGAVLVAEGEETARRFAKLILQRIPAVKNFRQASSVVVSHHL